MKKMLLIVGVFLTGLNSPVVAQTVAGIKGGVNFSNMFVEEVNDENIKVGFHAGFFVRSYLTDFISIQPEVNFTTKGSTITYDYLFGEGVTNYNFDYLEVPLLLGFELADVVRLQVGPYAAFLLGGNVENDADDDLLDFDNKINRDDFNNSDFGIATGAGFGGDGFELGLRYNYGLSEIGKTDNYNGLSYSLRNAHHSVWQIYAAFSL